VPHYDVNGKVALITGGGRGIGLGLASALARRGAKLALVDVDEDAIAQAASQLGADRAIGLPADVTDADSIGGAVRATVERLGGLDIVVANAGIAPTPAPVRVMPPEEFERVIEVNLLGVYRTVYAGLEQIVARRGQAVLVSSVYAFMNGMLASPYATAKAGVEQLGRALALELAPHGASATVAYFGFVDTRMVREAIDERPSGRQERLPAFLRKRITPEQAGEALARGIERRRQRVIAPRYWTVVSTARGLLNPAMDFASVRLDRVHEVVREAEAEARSPGDGSFGPS
jgi:NAD(P)-dependent dehydrogenase (short-subunit alcohol dehydrogenase family)